MLHARFLLCKGSGSAPEEDKWGSGGAASEADEWVTHFVILSPNEAKAAEAGVGSTEGGPAPSSVKTETEDDVRVAVVKASVQRPKQRSPALCTIDRHMGRRHALGSGESEGADCSCTWPMLLHAVPIALEFLAFPLCWPCLSESQNLSVALGVLRWRMTALRCTLCAPRTSRKKSPRAVEQRRYGKVHEWT
eukprot:1157236-Pelagomonas_calceolata.AAC.2